MSQSLKLIASCPKGLEQLLTQEAASLGATLVKESVGSLELQGSLSVAYRLCLWSRLANRVLLVLDDFVGATDEQLYNGMKAIPWERHIKTGGTLSVDFNGRSAGLRNSHFAALRCKDAIVDRFVERGDPRPSVDKQAPEVRVNVRLRKGRVVVAIDLAGESLHRRGYRQDGALAPLKENLAAAILLRCDWPGVASRGGALIDPMCGSGTLLIEGAMMAMGIAPGIQRRYWGFLGWLGHDETLWRNALNEAKSLRDRAMQRDWPEIRGYDASGKVVAQAEANIARVGLQKLIRVSRRELSELSKPSHRPMDFGLLVCNPPYGERLGQEAELIHLYRHLGQSMREHFQGWQAGVFTGNPELGKRMGVRSHRQYQMFNGTIPTRLLLFNIEASQFVDERRGEAGSSSHSDPALSSTRPVLSAGAQMFANRLRKNLKRLEKWRRREGIECFRAYDADMPEYAVAVDCYGTGVHISEYAAPPSIDETNATRRLREVIEVCSEVFGVPATAIAVKERRRQKGREQYQRHQPREEFFEVREGQAKVLVNLHDYLDTGLFLDHRPVRLDIARRARGKRFLNLFSYTAVASVQAGIGGARFTTSVDMSHTYLKWARRNLSLNGLSESRHRTEQGDCRRWLEACEDQYDLILLDPPTFSNSKRMDDVLDTQRDHGQLIDGAMACLAPGGLLIFSTNKRGFELDARIAERYAVEDKTTWSLDEDFKRRSRPIHYCWYITAK